MQKLFLTLLITISTVLMSYAQIEKGRFLAGGSISPSYSKNIYPTYNFQSLRFTLNLKVGYFLFKNFALGINESMLLVSSWEKDNSYSSNSYSQSHGIAPFARYYFLNFKKISLFGEVKVGIQLEKLHWKETFNAYHDTYSFSSKTTSINYSGSFGLDYFVTRNVAVELSVNYNYINPITSSHASYYTVGFSGVPKISSTNAFIGFQVFF